ncbi:epithelial splicing regulatory protein 1-like isoform X1 [Watersipora subatra]|uniref:epithelial splicing regulatory protein 1-like isoform X1 n=1 Tax=Watersipora subatra TaxID=2589382 RepID=UPI00355B839F
MVIMSSSPTHLTVFYIATAGKQGEELGSDESQIVNLVYLLFDVLNNKIVTVQQHHVKPTHDYSDNVLSEECKQLTGLNEELVKNAQPLELVLEEMDRFFKAKGIHPEYCGNNFLFCVDGPQLIRLCLQAEAMQKSIQLRSYFFKYFDLRKEFQKLYKRPAVSKQDMLEYLCLDPDASIDYGVRQVHDMASIIKRLLTDGHQFAEPERIKDRLQPGICNKSDYVDDDTVIRARGLPWQSSDADIAKFFTGLNIAKGGVALCLSQQGRRNGEALIRFENRESRDLALRKHKHHLGNRYIEVYKASGRDFLNVAGGSNTEAQAFLSRGAQCIIRMRGLPYTANAEQVLQFFCGGEKGVDVLDGKDGILFVHQVDGRATGDAFVLFATEDDANIALGKHRELIGTRYIELFKSTTAEVQQVLNRTMEPQLRNTPPAGAESIPFPSLGLSPMHHMNPALMPFLPSQATPSMPPTGFVAGHAVRDCVRLRGLPFEASVTDILSFLGDYARSIVFQGVHMVYNSAGTPSGEAFIQMDSEVAAESAAINRHKKFMLLSGMGGNKKRYIEVFQCSSADMSVVLTNPELPANLQLPGVNIPQNPPTFGNGLHHALNLTPPGLSSPQQGSPPTVPTSSTHNPLTAPAQPFALPQLQPQLQPLLPQRSPLIAQGLPSSSASIMGLGAYTLPSVSTAGAVQQPLLQQQLMAQLSQQQLLMAGQSPAFPGMQAGIPRPGMPAVPGLVGASPMIYYYPSPPISPQNYFNPTPAIGGECSSGQ